MTTPECWHGCGRPGTIRNSDGRSRCPQCQRDHNELVRHVLTDMRDRAQRRRKGAHV